MKLIALPVALLLSTSAFAEDGITMTKDVAKVQALLSTIPVVSKETGRMTLAERLASLGVSVQYVISGRLASDEIKYSLGAYQPGDVLYDFHTNDAPSSLVAHCPVWAVFSFIKRGKSWLPESRTANFYAFNKCEAPG